MKNLLVHSLKLLSVRIILNVEVFLILSKAFLKCFFTLGIFNLTFFYLIFIIFKLNLLVFYHFIHLLRFWILIFVWIWFIVIIIYFLILSAAAWLAFLNYYFFFLIWIIGFINTYVICIFQSIFCQF